MKVKVEYGNTDIERTEIEKTEIVEVNSIKQLYFKLKREYIAEHGAYASVHKIDGDSDKLKQNPYEFSELCEVFNTFYIGSKEGEYIEGWELV